MLPLLSVWSGQCNSSIAIGEEPGGHYKRLSGRCLTDYTQTQKVLTALNRKMFDAQLGNLLIATIDLVAGRLASALRRPVPGTAGRRSVRGLTDQVQIIRDSWGVPHIYAKNDRDLFAALGYVHAQDRLWQMDFNRRAAQGKLSEVLGNRAIDSDRFVRVVGLDRVAGLEATLLDDATRAIIEAYVQGINAFLDASANHLPVEFALLGYRPAPWNVTDVLAFNKLMALNLCGNWTMELFNACVLGILGEQRAMQLDPRYPRDQPWTIPTGVQYPTDIGKDLLITAKHAQGSFGLSDTAQGSNAWVASGSRTQRGRPLLAGDPHMALVLPSLWYEAHLEGGDYAVSGATLPGAPGVLIGHNTHIAWSLTNAMMDVQDLYIERFHPDDPTLYEWCGNWQRVEIVREEIRIRDRSDSLVEEVRITRHGPVISSVAALGGVPHPEHGLALKWTSLQPTARLNRAVLSLNCARNWAEFRAALTEWDSPPQNLVYADVDGHYGYVLAGDIPLRPNGDGRLPVPGWTGTYEWMTCIPAHSLPASYDPPDGLVVSANSGFFSAAEPNRPPLHGEWLNDYRANRITELLKAATDHDVQSFQRMQQDQRSLPGLQLAAIMSDLPMHDFATTEARDLLVAWDGELSAESIGGAIYSAFRYHLERLVYAELSELHDATVGVGLFDWLPGNDYLDRALPRIIARIKTRPDLRETDLWLGGGRTWVGILQQSMDEAVEDLQRRLGDDSQRWQYGRLHLIVLQHRLDRVPLVGRIFDRGPWPTGGDLDTICKGYMPRDTADGYYYVGPSYRLVCDTSDWDRSRSILSSGQSGNVASSHYCDMTASWLGGDYHPMLWRRERVEEYAKAKLILDPFGTRTSD